MRARVFLRPVALVVVGLVLTACSGTTPQNVDPRLAPRGTTMTTAKPTRQDLSNKISLIGKVALNPTFGLVAPIDGEIRYLTVAQPTATPTKPTKVANLWVNGKSTAKVEVPAGAVFSGRLVDDRSKVIAGTPIVSARHAGYGLVADIDGAQAYKLSDALGTVIAQITNGPGPFSCTVLGTIAALPAGTVPEPPAAPTTAAPSGQPVIPPRGNTNTNNANPSEATGLRVVCTAPADVRLINGAAATLQLVTATASNVMVLPVEAVAGGQGKGKVDVLRPDGSRETRDVVLGLTDGKVIEIKSGLKGDETVAVPGPDLPAGKDQSGQNGPNGQNGVITK